MISYRTLHVLNTLLKVNNDRIQCYTKALNLTVEKDLRQAFSKCIVGSELFKEDLASEIDKWGGTPSWGSRSMGKFFKLWMQVKMIFLGHDRYTILDFCEFGEKIVLYTYEKALNRHFDILSLDQEKLLISHLQIFRRDYGMIKQMRAGIL